MYNNKDKGDIILIFIWHKCCYSFNRHTYTLPLTLALFYMFLMICCKVKDIMHITIRDP